MSRAGISDVVGNVVDDSSNLDKSPDARMSEQNGAAFRRRRHRRAESQRRIERRVHPPSPRLRRHSRRSGSRRPGSLGAQLNTAADIANAVPTPTNHPVSPKQLRGIPEKSGEAQQKAIKAAKKKGLSTAGQEDAAKTATNAAIPVGAAPTQPVVAPGIPAGTPGMPGTPITPQQTPRIHEPDTARRRQPACTADGRADSAG